MTLAEILIEARMNSRAIGHFNISNLEMLKGILTAAKEVNTPVLIGTSENEAEYIGRRGAVALVKAAREEYGVEVFLNADHHKSVEATKKAIDAGYESVHIDLSRMPYEENWKGTKEVVDYARASGREISVEGELGVLATESSKIYEGPIDVDPASFTTPEQAAEFVARTGVDRFAPAVGNFHGISTTQKKKLDIDLVGRIRQAVPLDVALVLHGGSGTSDKDISEAIRQGIANIHISTELRVAYTEALRKSLLEQQEETTPYKIFPSVIEAVRQKTLEKLAVFVSLDLHV